jgi:thioredoxin reductase (NADPH)
MCVSAGFGALASTRPVNNIAEVSRSMLTPDEVGALPLFASLSDTDFDRLVQTSADIRSAPARTPSTRAESALYAVLSGKIEVVKRFDGVERPLGVRLPGTIFGEVPLASCHGFPWWLPRGVPLRVIQPTTKDPAYR